MPWIYENNQIGQVSKYYFIVQDRTLNLILDTDIFVIMLSCREEVVSAVRCLSNFVHSVRKAYAIPVEEVDPQYASAVQAFDGMPPLKTGERHLRMLIVDDNSKEDTRVYVSPSMYTIPPGRAIPSFDPEWLSIFKENARATN